VNLLLLCRLLGLVAMLIGASMAFSLPWAWLAPDARWAHERAGFFALLGSMAICFAVGGLLRFLGRRSDGQLFRKEAMAVVGLSWILATVLGAFPYVLSDTRRGPDMPMSFVDAMFESQSGFSTTGATVLTDLEVHGDSDRPPSVPRCILFWRSSTHFLGGLGIIVLFVAILGQGSAGKALMRAEMPGPGQATPQARMQHTAWLLFLLYAGLNAALTLLLLIEDLSPFDALCHAFGTMATGGFSTYNDSIGHFGPAVQMTIVLFMLLAGTNFMLMYWVVLLRPRRMLADVEWRTYVGVILSVTVLVVAVGLYCGDFGSFSGMTATAEAKQAALDEAAEKGDTPRLPALTAIRHGLFQVVSIMTTTGFCTDNFDLWNSFGRGVLLILMFVGGCAGSTGGGLKVIRHILFFKILRLEVEHTFRPSVVRPLRLAGKPVEDQEPRRNILVYFGLILAIFVLSWLFTITFEPDDTWTREGHRVEHKLIDAAGCVAATLNNIGPGLGVIGATENYTHFRWYTKILFIWLMMIGRLEIFVILVIFIPRFLRTQ